MAWIETIDNSDTTGELKEVYDQLKARRGKVANIMKVQSLNPRAMKAHLELYVTLMFGKSGLTREERELIAVAVSVANRCDYCANHHAEALNHYWKNDERMQKLMRDPLAIEVPQRVRQMLEYAVKLTRAPWDLSAADVNALRQVGFSDEDILNINLIASHFNFVNRIATGLGVEFSAEEVHGYRV